MTRPLLLTPICRPEPGRSDALAVQVYRDLLAAIRDGRIARGSRLPSSRAAASELGLSRSTVNVAYDLLRAEGVVAIRRGAAPCVTSPSEPRKPLADREAVRASERGRRLAGTPRGVALAGPSGTMAPGEPSESLFPADEWGRSLRRAARRSHGPIASYAEPYGHRDLRQILSERLASDRGLSVDPERILITPGTQASLALAAHLTTDPGDLAAIEDPGHLGARAAFHGAGLRLASLPVDAEGARANAVPPEARLVYVTPSNQYPLGVRLSHARRMALLDRARAIGAVILEDDYDSEFLWRGREIAALAAEAPEGRVIYTGSASKVLLPALRIGWMVAPSDMIDVFRAAQRNLGLLANLHTQIALADMMRSGRYRAQLSRIARVYEARGHALAAALSAIEGVAVREPDGGVQITARFTEGDPEAHVVAALSATGFAPTRLSLYCNGEKRSGLVIGFADATPERIDAFARTLSRALKEAPLPARSGIRD